ncbi:MAG: hypothetical protein ACYC5H_17190 [Methylovirgula sp.]
MTATKASPSRSRTRNSRLAIPPEAQTAQSPKPGRGNRRPSKDAASVAEYIAAITAELAGMAGGARLDMLTYFLNMARLEAEFHMHRRE